ncbi:MAG: hypothetical protein RLN85_03035, partial [Pseudomonadales bacterium]
MVDLGAGNQKLNRYLPATCGYYPVDCVAQFPETHIADFNKDFTLPDVSNPIFVCAGLLEYVVDWGKFFSTLRKHAPGATVIASYHLRDNSSRQEMLTCNNFTDVDEVLSELAKHMRFLLFWFDRVKRLSIRNTPTRAKRERYNHGLGFQP